MTRFDDRWKQLVDAARRSDRARFAGVRIDAAHVDSGRIDAARATHIAEQARDALAHSRANVQEWKRIALAASLFVACLIGLAWAASAFDFGPTIGDARHDIARWSRRVPSTNFIPAPPRPTDIGLPSLSELEPQLARWPGISFVNSFDDWFTSTQPTAEISR